MSIILLPDNKFQLNFQHGNYMVTSQPFEYSFEDENIKIEIEYGSRLGYIAITNFDYSYNNLEDFARLLEKEIETLIKK